MTRKTVAVATSVPMTLAMVALEALEAGHVPHPTAQGLQSAPAARDDRFPRSCRHRAQDLSSSTRYRARSGRHRSSLACHGDDDERGGLPHVPSAGRSSRCVANAPQPLSRYRCGRVVPRLTGASAPGIAGTPIGRPLNSCDGTPKRDRSTASSGRPGLCQAHSGPVKRPRPRVKARQTASGAL